MSNIEVTILFNNSPDSPGTWARFTIEAELLELIPGDKRPSFVARECLAYAESACYKLLNELPEET